MELNDFFGVDFNRLPFETNKYLDLLGIRRKIESTGPVKRLAQSFGEHHAFVDVAKRQQTLLFLKPLLSKPFMPFDKYHEIKDVNTASDEDRRYNSEERLLQIALAFALGESYKKLMDNDFKPDTIVLRTCDKYADERYERLRGILDEVTKSITSTFKEEKLKQQAEQPVTKPSLLSKLFK